MAAALRFPPSGVKAVITPYYGIVNALGEYPAGYQKLRNPTTLSIEPTVEEDSIVGTEIENDGQNLDSLKDFGDFNFNIVMNRTDAFNLALHTAGTRTDLDVSSGSGVAITVDVKADSYAPTGFRNLTDATVTGLVLDTDFIIADAPNGILKFLDTATTVGAEATGVSGTVDHDAYQGDIISLVDNTTIKGRFFGAAKDKASGRFFELVLNELSLSADGPLNLINNDRINTSLKGTIATPNVGPYIGNPGYFRLISSL